VLARVVAGHVSLLLFRAMHSNFLFYAGAFWLDLFYFSACSCILLLF
jgi:hypothetical protein